IWKYIANRFLTFVENILLGAKLSEYHTGYRAFSRNLLEQLPFEINSDDFVFDNQILAQIIWYDYTVAEISCPTKYFAEASSINLIRSIKYGLECLLTAMKFRMAKMKLISSKLFPQQ
ncbi:MAG: glycosyltransferase family 2 protein, partial [bacterium]